MTFFGPLRDLLHCPAKLKAALAEVQCVEQRRALLLAEYRHRARNDLMALSAMLRLRAKYIEGPAKASMLEAARNAVALGRIHARLEHALRGDEGAVVDVQAFLVGVCQDLDPPMLGLCSARGTIGTERAVSLGMLVHQLVGDSRVDGAVVIAVRLDTMGRDYVLEIADDRPKPNGAAADALRVRLVRGLVGQLRGQYSRADLGHACLGKVRFPITTVAL